MPKGEYERPPYEERFWAKVLKTDTCWLWTAATNQAGYGLFQSEFKSTHVTLAHRVAWMLVNGEIPEGKFLLHHCDNPPCVRPDHLYVGTQADNVNDCRKRNRWNPFGHKNKEAQSASTRQISQS